MTSYSVYVLKGINDQGQIEYYTGMTGRDISERLKEHLEGKSKYTKRLKKIKVMYLERGILSKTLAHQKELEIKQMTRAEKEKLVNQGRPKNTGNNRNKWFDKTETISLKTDYDQWMHLKQFPNMSEEIRDSINFKKTYDEKCKKLLNSSYYLTCELEKKYGGEERGIFDSILGWFDTLDRWGKFK